MKQIQSRKEIQAFIKCERCGYEGLRMHFAKGDRCTKRILDEVCNGKLEIIAGER